MADVVAWIRDKVRDSAPREGLEPGDVGQSVSALAQALASMDTSRPMVFGLQVGPEERERVVALKPEFRAALVSWRGYLVEHHGAEGSTFLDDILHRHGVTLGEAHPSSVVVDRVALEPAEQAVFERLTRLVGDPSSLRGAWEASGYLEGDETVGTWVGKPDVDRARALARAYEREYEQAFPLLLLQILLRFDGIEIGAASEPGGCTVLPGAELGEPLLWSADYGDPFMFADAPFDGIDPFVIGGLADSGFVTLVAKKRLTDPAVYWVSADFSSEPATRIAANVAQFVEAWCDADLLLEVVLSRRGVPGWG